MKGVHTQAQKASDSDHTADTPLEIDHHPKHQMSERPKEGSSTPPQASQQSMPTTMDKVGNNPPQLPVHSFAGVKDVVYGPPTTDNITAKLKPLPPKKADTPLKAFAPVYDLQIASDVYVQLMNAQVTLTQCELLLLSPKVRNQV